MRKRLYPKQVDDFKGKIYKNSKMKKVCFSCRWRTSGYEKHWESARRHYVNTFWKSYPVSEREKVTKCNFNVISLSKDCYIWSFSFGY